MPTPDDTLIDGSSCRYAFRSVLFLTVCMVARIALAMWVRTASASHLWRAGIVFLLQSIGFAYIFAFGLRKSGGETFGCPIWWNDMRPIHAMLYAMAAWFALKGNGKHASTVLSADVTIGVVAFAYFHAKRTNILL